jgi:hypothetical protein
VRGLSGGFEDTIKRRLTGQEDALVGQFRHDLVRRHLGMGWLVGDRQQMLTFFVTELMGWCGSMRLRLRIFGPLPPSLHRADAQLKHRARRRQSRAGGNRFIKDVQHVAAI